MVWLEASVQGLPILFATFWFGSTLFTDFVLMPAVMGMSPAGQRELGQRIGPITARLEPRAAVATIVLGGLRGTVFGPVQSLSALVGTAYGLTWLVSLLLAVGLFAFGEWVLTPAIARIPRTATPEEQARLIGQVRRYTLIQLAAFLLILVAMVAMHYEG